MRWVKFTAVGALGIFVQLGALALLVHGGGVDYLLATVIAVEAAIVHNFIWHWRWTWSDRRRAGSDRYRYGPDRSRSGPDRNAARNRCSAGLMLCFLRFQSATGVVSLLGNVLFTGLLASAADLDPVLANAAAIVLCSLLNYLACDRFAFARR